MIYSIAFFNVKNRARLITVGCQFSNEMLLSTFTKLRNCLIIPVSFPGFLFKDCCLWYRVWIS